MPVDQNLSTNNIFTKRSALLSKTKKNRERKLHTVYSTDLKKPLKNQNKI